ncbi:MAG: DNA mismatch repair protein MutS [Candidatus Lokiarchaeota archaeon]|nr:DNA mismatch repair protein MutS [Candidatus Lokiarchaeota archaeon]
MKKLTPMQRQYLELKRQHKDCLLLFRLGDFYELFNEDAEIASEILDIVLTSRGEGVDSWPMCGVPYHSVEQYIAELLEAGHTVALADQVEDSSEAKGLVRREVVRVITPGTVLESSMLESNANNYLTAMVVHEEMIGLAAVDISTGEFIATEFEAEPDSEEVMSELARLNPSELLLPESMAGEKIVQDLREGVKKVDFREDLDFSARSAERAVKEQFGVTTLDGYGLADKPVALGAVGAILAYLSEVHRGQKAALTGISTYSIQDHMTIDAITQRNLELVKNARDGSTRGTLLSVLSETSTPMGRRKLKQWMLQPLMDSSSINERLDAVEEIARSALVRKNIAEKLDKTGDFERLVSRIAFGTANARDLVSLRTVLAKIPEIREILQSCDCSILQSAADSIDALEDLRNTLEEAVVDDPPATVKEGGIIKDGYDEQLDSMKSEIAADKEWIRSLQGKERKRTGIKSLKVGYNKVFGYYLEVTNTNTDKVPPEYERKQTLTNSERYITPELKEKEATVLAGEEKINHLEYELYEDLRAEVKEVVKPLRRNSQAIALADVIVSLAEVAVKRGYNRPKIVEDKTIRVVEGRHPAMEVALGRNEFVPNSLSMGEDGTTLLILTGPNMGGKSTYMRQNALIVLLAQMGSFVPAKRATVGLVDRIFTRVGAFDDLTASQSTFMVEMIETANILNNATERSLVILDEVGRGTSTYDGMALAWAVAEEIAKMKTRTLFATHYHHLTQMAEDYHGIKNVHTLAKEAGDDIVFLYKVVGGPTDESYGVHVASLAGVPEPVVSRAAEMLVRFENEKPVAVTGESSEEPVVKQMSLEPLTVEDPILEEIKHMDLDRTTPIDSLLALREFQERIRDRE